jgi:hypothetical protein
MQTYYKVHDYLLNLEIAASTKNVQATVSFVPVPFANRSRCLLLVATVILNLGD